MNELRPSVRPPRRPLWFVPACLAAFVIPFAAVTDPDILRWWGELPRLRATPLPAAPAPAPAAAGACTPRATRVTVARVVLDAWRKRATRPPRTARLVPAYADGQKIGVKVYAIQPGSPWSLLGIKNGDTLKHIMGAAIDPGSDERSLFGMLFASRADPMTIDISRLGCQVTMLISES